MRVLLTGGAGYIGSHTLVELLAEGHDICVIDSYANSSPEALARVGSLTNRNFRTEEADIRNGTAVRRIFGCFRPEAVIHFAGLKAVGEGEARPVDYYDVNIAGTLRLIEAMDEAGCGRIIFSSSATVYGDPDYLPLDEAHPCKPASVYGRTKHMAEQILTDWVRARPGTAAVILRYFNPVGAHESGQIGEDPQGIPNNLLPFISQVAVGRRERLSIFGSDYDTRDGTGLRDYIHVVDLARAHVAALNHAADHDGIEILNIGTGTGTTVREMLAAFERACGQKLPHQVIERRPGDIAACYADPSKANRLLDWKAERGLDDMCASTWKWQSDNPKGYRS
ncbi:UDP-glucose 4-epimerase GalE [Paracoccus sanguinis]|uniref:UDP-glucose 4-epimerase n=1 Tax=Paracoccus sanguinis TaxID=1545044 RepID=A0A099G9X5_9RHOB|nr:UDP-glucose 4-epimerase GalE [Paracoccus sanguinis]KGJ19407.1 UDP-galactose-4-epimerase [Paracoccus sanguinis]